MICRALLVLCFHFTISDPSYSQKLTCYDREIIPLDINSLSEEIRYCQFGNIFYYLSSQDLSITNRQIKINKLDLSKKLTTQICIQIPNDFSLDGLPEFSITEKALLIQDFNSLDIYLFKKDRNNAFKFSRKIKTPNNVKFFSMIQLSDDKFLLKDYYNHHPLDNPNAITLAIYNSKNSKFESLIHPSGPCIAFSHLQSSYIATNQKYISLAEACGDKIQIYDTLLKPIKNICLPILADSIILCTDSIPFETDLSKTNPKWLIENLKDYSNERSRIESIVFIDAEHLFISIIPKHYYKNKRLGLIYSIKEDKFSKPEIYGRIVQFEKSIEFPSFPSLKPFCTDQQLTILCSDDYFPDSLWNANEFQINKNKYYEDHDPHFVLLRYKISINN